MSWGRNHQKDAPFLIQRNSEEEILKAISDLENRGFKCCFGPKLHQHQYWLAKMQRRTKDVEND